MPINKNNMAIYHGCSKRNIDGTNRLIKKREVCSKLTYEPFWMEAQDIDNRVKTRSQEQNRKDINQKDLDQYFKKIHIERGLMTHIIQK